MCGYISLKIRVAAKRAAPSPPVSDRIPPFLLELCRAMSQYKEGLMTSAYIPDSNFESRPQKLASKLNGTLSWKFLVCLAIIVGTYVSVRVTPLISSGERFLHDHSSHEPCAVRPYINDFDWYSLQPSEDINWVSCFDGHKCARLSLPLDYLTEHDGGPRTEIALRMIPATDKENYLGPILVNPGGPGGSGTQLVASYGKSLSAIVGPRFDIFGFDPRGTGFTTPSAQCFDTQSQKAVWSLQQGSLITGLNTTDGSIPYARGRHNVLGQRCLEALGGSGIEQKNGTASEWGPARFMGTPSVATDMLRITQKMGFEKLQYIGYSYGTVLGQYFSAMYPDKIGRVVIDGVYDGEDYRQGSWVTNLEDTDVVFDSLATFCYQAGSLKCKIYESNVSAIQNRITAARHSLAVSPISVAFSDKGPFLFTEALFVEQMFQATYEPLKAFPIVADTIIAIEDRNTSAIASTFSRQASYECECKEPQTPWQPDFADEALAAIACGDAPYNSYDKVAFAKYLANLTAQSSLAGPLWAGNRLRCSEWPIRSKWNFKGPLAANETSHPILILSPTFDPVCPISDAQRVRSRYAGAGFLEQYSYGHCTNSFPSLCTAKHLREYFVNGTLPVEGSVCEVDVVPFEGSSIRANVLSLEDLELLEALQDFSSMVPRFGRGF